MKIIKDFIIKNQLALITLLVACIACYIVYRMEESNKKKREKFSNKKIDDAETSEYIDDAETSEYVNNKEYIDYVKNRENIYNIEDKGNDGHGDGYDIDNIDDVDDVNGYEGDGNDIKEGPITLPIFNNNVNKFIDIFSTKPFSHVFQKIINNDWSYKNPILSDDELNNIIRKYNTLLIKQAIKAKTQTLIILDNINNANDIFSQDEIKMAKKYWTNQLNNIDLVLTKLNQI